MLTKRDLLQLKQRCISKEKIETQIAQFKEGFPFLRLFSAAGVGKGIKRISLSEEEDECFARWDEYLKAGHDVVKFVPSSGAASRMFKDLFAFLDADYDEPCTDFEKTFFKEIFRFAFYDELNETLERREGKTVPALLEEKQYKLIVRTLLLENGMNYGGLPKGLLLFHRYEGFARTPLEEHLVEGALYAADEEGNVSLHFTVSPEHHALFEALVREKAAQTGAQYGVTYHISFSEQKKSTDTLAVTPQNDPFRLDDGSMLFRPGGHGALIENLNDLDADIVFIKNIDNVVPDRFRSSTVRYKRMLAGVLVKLQERTFSYLRRLDGGCCPMTELKEMLQFLREEFSVENPSMELADDIALAKYLREKLNRPIRVCGMVRNVGEPGGGPFLAYNGDGTISPQILESSQINMQDEEAKRMFQKGTHFNPVDLVCAIKDYRGISFPLQKYVDETTGFISHKSKNGKDLKALELPGLWNGAMSDWNTVFVEVPLDTFNPVKTVNDLLRNEHQ